MLVRVERGVRAVRSAAIVNGEVVNAHGVSREEVESWRSSAEGQDHAEDDREKADRLFPVRVPLVPSSDDEAPIGYILVGPRPDGTLPSKDEQEALEGVSEAIARAIRNVIKREAREKRITDLIEDNRRRIAELEALLQPDSPFSRNRSPGTA